MTFYLFIYILTSPNGSKELKKKLMVGSKRHGNYYYYYYCISLLSCFEMEI